MPCASCFHCGEPVPEGSRISARVGAQTHAVCCIGCKAAAEWIDTLGLADYYRLRDAPAERPVPVADFIAWDRPQLQRMYVRKIAGGEAEICVLVEGLRCAACSWLIERALRGVPGVREIDVNPGPRQLRLVWMPAVIALSDILRRLAQLGYTPHPLDSQALDMLGRHESRTAMKRLIVAGLGSMQAMMYAVALYAGTFDGMDPATRDFFRWLGLLVTTPVVFYSAQPFFNGAWRELRARGLGMDTAIAFAVALIYLASVYETARGGASVYFDSASMFVFLLLGGRYLEMRGRQRATDVVDALARMQPALAQRRTPSGALETVGVHELNEGDIVVVAAGSAVPADGILLDGGCEVDESLLTGESRSRARRHGDTLIAGSVMHTGPIELHVSRIGADTVLSSIVRLVGRAHSERPQSARLGDRIATHFVAGVLVLAIATAIAWMWIDPSRAFAASLAVLVVSCPCAFALSVPIVHARATAALARMGVLVLKPNALEKLARIDHVVFDKTGTLTKNRLELAGVTSCGAQSSAHCMRIAAQLEDASNHPLGAAIRAVASISSADSDTVCRNLRTFNGAGVEGDIDGRRYRIGRPDFALSLSGNSPQLADDDSVILADHLGALARFTFRETIRDGAAEAVGKLRERNIALTILSGDSRSRVSAVAARLGISDFRARLCPEEKLRALQTLRTKGATVCMVGDGINDAPVLAGADIAIALGSGAQLAQFSADIVLASDEIGAVADARALAVRTMNVLRQNLYWAFAYNFSCIPLAAMGYIPPWLAAIGMSASSLLVVLNALRIAPPARDARPSVETRTITLSPAAPIPA